MDDETIHCFALVVLLSWLVYGLMSWSTIFQSCWDGAIASCVFTGTLGSLKRLAQEHYTATVGFELVCKNEQ